MAIKAVQQFQLGTVMNTRQQAMETMRRMKKAGYQGIELCGFMIRPTPFMVRMLTKAAGMPVGKGGGLDWKEMVEESGLAVPAIHEYLNLIEEKPEEIIREAEAFHTTNIVVTGMYRFDYGSEDEVKRLAQRLNRAGEVLQRSGLQLCYHNHNIEFGRFAKAAESPDGSNGTYKNAFSILVGETDPRFVGFEFDSYWASDAGANALAVMQSLGDRLKLYHINDRGSRQRGAQMTPIVREDSMELGTGNMDLAPMIQTALSAGVSAIVLESHKNWIDKSPIRSFEVSAKYLNRFVSV